MTRTQKEFEEWFNKQKDSEYCSDNVKSLLAECWTASRQVLVVELPCWSEYDTPRQYMDAVRQRLDELGVKHTSR